jgi:pyruvate dehydrogenase E1 component alpha subunit
MSIRMQKQDRVCMVFFGDGATNEGAFHEALNMASIWKLPVVFVCENNKYGMSMDIALAMAVPNVADRASAYAMPGVAVDGNDLPAVVAAAAIAVDRARSGGGPSLVECKTYRWRGHSKSDRNLYRTKEEIDTWRKRDPIRLLEAELLAHDRLDAADLAAIEKGAAVEIERALEFAKSSPRSRSIAAHERRLCRLSSLCRPRRRPSPKRRSFPMRRPSAKGSRRRWKRIRASSSSARMSACTAARSACRAIS